MSKVICDVCGTTYPETAGACPICGCAKNATEQTAAEGGTQEETSYNYVKGGRFSKSNVRKRNKKNKPATIAVTQSAAAEGVNKGLVIAVLLLLLAIVAVLCYIGFRFLFPAGDNNNNSLGSSQTQNPGDENKPANIPCTDLLVHVPTTVFMDTTPYMLGVDKDPIDTTDVVTYQSSNDLVATIDATGRIVPVATGTATITVTCGTITRTFEVVCDLGEPTPPVGDEETPEPSVTLPEDFVLELKYKEFSLTEKYPDPVSVYKKHDEVKATDITWTSDNEEVVTIDEKGLVSAVGKGSTKVHGEIGGQKVSCVVYVSFDPATIVEPAYIISHEDVTLYLDGSKSFRLSLKTEEGAKVQNVVWTVNEEGYVDADQLLDGNIVALKSTSDLKNKYVIVSATVEDYTYSCKVRIEETQKKN